MKKQNCFSRTFRHNLKDNGAEVIESKDWEKRRLAYEMNGFREGIYHIVNVTSPSTVAQSTSLIV